ncbi:MAG: hypothetical protein NT166_10430 [Candidatus Aminicenantes bacterium]|nr:hypothetical protein [Candidatus Aminicenantes bacterium]
MRTISPHMDDSPDSADIFSSFTTHHSPLTIHHSPFTIHHSPFIIHHSSFIIHHSILTPPVKEISSL